MRRDFCETPTSLPIGCAASWPSRAPTNQRRGERRRSRCRVVSLAFEITPWHRRRPEADQSARLTAPQRRRKLNDSRRLRDVGPGLRLWFDSCTFPMMTGIPKQEDIVQRIEAGVNGYIAKPFAPQTLKEKIQELMGDVVRKP